MDMDVPLPGPLPEDTLNTLKTFVMATLESMGVQEVDDTLAHYIVVLVKNRHTGRQLNADLTTFLGENTVQFTHWLCDLLVKAEVVDVDEDDFTAFAEKESALKDSKPPTSTTETDAKHSLQKQSSSSHTAVNRTVSSASLFSSLRRQSTVSKVGSRVLTAVLSTGAGAAFPTMKRHTTDDSSPAHKRTHIDSDSGINLHAFTSQVGGKSDDSTQSKRAGMEGSVGTDMEEALSLRRTEQQLNEGKKGAAATDCPFFPSCKNGDKCRRHHPKPTCRFDDKCTNDSCTFNHTIDFSEGGAAYHTSANSQYTASTDRSNQEAFRSNTTSVSTSNVPKRMCRFGSWCRHDNCPFEHQNDSGGGLKSSLADGNRGSNTNTTSSGYDRGYSNSGSRNRDGGGGYDSGFKSGSSRYGDGNGPSNLGSLSERLGGRGVCRFDGRCRKPNCPFQHLQDNSKTRSIGGFGSQNQYANTQSSPSRPSYSGGGSGSSNSNSYASENARGSGFGQRERPPCRFQDRCTKPNCPFTHDGNSGNRNAMGSDARGPRNNRPRVECKFGSRCTKAQCTFYHSEKDHISDRVLVLEEADS